MNSKEIDIAMKNRTPVFYDGKRYKRILEYISWYDNNGERKLSTTLLSEQGNYSVRVLAKKVNLYVKEEEMQKTADNA